jgi:hypothetical protein
MLYLQKVHFGGFSITLITYIVAILVRIIVVPTFQLQKREYPFYTRNIGRFSLEMLF